MKTVWLLLFSTLGITPAWASDAPAAPHHGERRAMMEKHCAENPERCKQMKAQMEQRRAQCEGDPAKCREQHQARAAERFKQADADGNGALSKAEAEKGMPGLARRFDAIDGNKDGQLSRDEIEAARKARAGGKSGERHHGPG